MKRRKPHSNRFWVLLFLGIAALCLLSPLFTVYGPTEVDLGRVLQAPGAAHWFGTDSLGRDVFARVLYGGMVSLGVAAVTTAVRPRMAEMPYSTATVCFLEKPMSIKR